MILIDTNNTTMLSGLAVKYHPKMFKNRLITKTNPE